ncbi:sensor histidine kinase [Mycobacterium vicinigordonae]|uniref:histidine kinase n=1 Tax=Mycobacterium vicinigordonae TaxID=1719132 RepID=A0A7D6IUF6_9MYCO|nr:histidine kinase [Mycobacterium vicinigordonae]QLL09139.1 two-component sensor histidine kinase [Mycobacterium vicinigordonae]
MLDAAASYLREQLRRRSELLPVGVTWSSIIVIDTLVVCGAVLSMLQRPSADLPVGLAAFAIMMIPSIVFFFINLKLSPVWTWATWTSATALMLFATSTPVRSDFAPGLLMVMVGAVGTLTAAVGGLLAALSSVALLLAASGLHRLDNVVLYLGFIAGAWLIGFLMYTHRRLLVEVLEARDALAEHAAADERRRIAREVHDVIAHSLSITLLHVTGVRRALQHDRDPEELDDAVEALEQAERLGRQAMADIRRTVGLLDGPTAKAVPTSPEPGVDDIGGLVTDFERAGLKVTLRVEGSTDCVSPAVGLALYRIAQESLANIAKHAADSESVVRLEIAGHSARLAVDSRLSVKLPVRRLDERPMEGRGLRGMRQRVELLGGDIDVGPTECGWSVNAEIPLDEGSTGRRPRRCRFS